jgi:Protein of unknown function (DUF3696)
MEKKLRPEDIRVYYFERMKENGKETTKISKLEVNQNGEIEGGLKGFFDADMQHINKFFENLKRSQD